MGDQINFGDLTTYLTYDPEPGEVKWCLKREKITILCVCSEALKGSPFVIFFP
jgi:hypothetical protein